MNQQFASILEQICEQDLRYKRDAYDFVMEALSHAQKRFKRVKHVSGKELLESAKDLLIDQYGPMALSILNHWGIRTTEDFGHIVFNLVNNKILSKTDEDSLNDFKDGYNLNDAFGVNYRRQLDKKISRMRSV